MTALLRTSDLRRRSCPVFSFLASHMGDIIVTLVLVLLVGAVIVRMVKDKKSGKGGCGCGCEGCANAPCCHANSSPKH